MLLLDGALADSLRKGLRPNQFLIVSTCEAVRRINGSHSG
jgi:hypothetical protein